MLFIINGIDKQQFSSVLLIAFVLLAIITSTVHAQSNTDYLKTLEGEVSNLELDDRTKLTGTEPATLGLFDASQPGGIADLTPGLSVEQFEQVLQRNYMGSYLFYKRLNDQQQQEVYTYYQSNPDPNKLRDKILQISKR